MKCYIKRINNNSYFSKHLFDGQNHWTPKIEAKLFDTVSEARASIKVYKLKNCEIEKVKK